MPQLSANWWEHHVLDVLTYQQQERVKQSGIYPKLMRKMQNAKPPAMFAVTLMGTVSPIKL